MKLDLRCEACGRWLGSTDADVDATIKCANCKHNTHFKISFLSTHTPWGACYTKDRSEIDAKDQKAAEIKASGKNYEQTKSNADVQSTNRLR